MTYTSIPIYEIVDDNRLGNDGMYQVGTILISPHMEGAGHRVILMCEGRCTEGVMLEDDLDRLLETYDYGDGNP